MWKNSCFFFLSFFFVSFSPAFAQKEKDVATLKIILEDISQQHDIRFNYIEDEIVVFKIVPPPKEWTLDAKLAYIKKKTQLRFIVTDNKYYTIFNNKKVDKPLCGYLIDVNSEMPVENAMVNILNTNSITTTDVNGYFELPIVSSNAIEIRHQSYATLKIDVRDLYVSTCPKIKFVPVSQELTEVVAQQYLTSGITQKKNGTLEIKPKKFGILPGLIEPDVLQTLQQVPGIYSIDESVSNLNVRGGTHDQNLFLWNGVRIFETGHFFGLISAFNPSLAHTITLTKDGSSAFFGESVSSLVDISTHAKNIENDQASISSNLISAEFYAKTKLTSKASFEVSGRRSFTDVTATPTYQRYRDRVFQNTIVTDMASTALQPINSSENFYFYDLTLQYQQKIGAQHELTIDAITIKNHLDIHQTRATVEKESTLKQQNFGASLQWKSQWNDKNATQINFSGSSYNLNATNESIQNNQILDQTNALVAMGFQIKNTHKWSETFRFNNGYQFDQIHVINKDEINTPQFYRNVAKEMVSHIGVAEMEYHSPNQNTVLTTGVRVNYFDKFDAFRVEPRIQFHQQLTEKFSLEILAEQKSQTLSQIIDLQQDFLGIEKRRWTLADESTFPIQKSNQAEIGFAFKTNGWLMTVDSFYKKVNGITSSGQGFQNQFEFERATGQYQVLGSEMLIQKKFRRFYAWASYSFNRNQYTFDTLNQRDFPNNYELTYTVATALIYDWNSFKIALGSKWHSGKPVTTPASNVINTDVPAAPRIEYNEPNNTHLPAYFQLNFSASKDWKLNPKLTLQTSISVLNLLNKRNTINRFYRINAAQNGIDQVDTYSLERTPNVNVKLSF